MSDVDTIRKLLVEFWYKAYRAGMRADDGSELEDVDALEALFDQVRNAALDDLLEAMPEKRNGSVDSQTGAPVGMQGCVDHGFDLALADVTATIHQLKSSKKGADDE